MAESSRTKPEKVINMKLTPSSKLLHSVAALSDPQFNPSGLGRLDITPKGLEITVRNTKTGVLGNLHLKPPGLILHCTKPIVGKIVDVGNIFIFVSGAIHDDDTVIIFHYQGSNKLTFILGSNLDEEHNVDLLDMNAAIEGFPPVALFCEAALTSNYLRSMIERLEQPGMPQRVFVSIEELLVTYLIGKHAWFAKFGEAGIIGTRGVALDQNHRGMFVMPHLQAMREASYVAPGLAVSFLSEPADSVMMRFGLDIKNKLGDLVFIYKADRIVSNYQDKKESSSEEGGSGSEEVNVSDSEDMALHPDELEYLGFSVGPSDSSLAESSQRIPEKVIDFQLKPAGKLLNSAFALSNSEFNPTGMGRVDITEAGFEITVCNTETGVPANLHLKPSGMIKFHCSKPIVGKFINVNNIFLVLVGVSHDDDTVTIFHLDGSNDLTFILGSSTDEEYKVKLLELDAEVKKLPDITLFSEAVLSSDVLRRMIHQLEETRITQQVSVSIAEKLVTYIIGKKAWVFKYGGDKLVGTSGTTPRMIHRAWFTLHHLQAMSHASALGSYLVVCILSEPVDTVMIRFCFRELGNLVFIYKAEQIDPNCLEEIESGSEAGKSGSHEEVVSDTKVISLPPDQALQILEFKFR